MTDPAKSIASRLGVEREGESIKLTKDSLLAAMGGTLGIAESVLPAFSFSISYALGRSALVSVLIAAGLGLGFILYRLVRKQALSSAFVGVLAIALAAFLALRDGGSAVDYFVPGFYTNAAYGSVLLLSVLVRWPILGFAGKFLFGLDNWRTSKPLYRRFQLLTLIWVGFFALRLAVQLPLYFANQVELLATSRVVMGAPAYAGLLALTWVVLKRISSTEKE